MIVAWLGRHRFAVGTLFAALALVAGSFAVAEALRYSHAPTREKEIKQWRRDWKVALIEEANPDWDDLYSSICK